MDKSTMFISQLLILGALICLTTAVSLRHKRNLIAEYHALPGPEHPEIVQFPHESTCHYYYLKLSEEDITLHKCPDGDLFDYIDHNCSSKEKARCWSRQFGKRKHPHIALRSRGPFRCPFAWGKYPDIKNCTKYYVCLNGKVKHKKCAPYEHFDKVSQTCVAAIEGVCADETDVMDSDYKCPRTWGSFSVPKDCSKYYECLEKKPSLRTCPTNTLFHEKKEKCVPLNHVHCGSRHNPYSKKEDTPKIEEPTHPENPKITSNKPNENTDKEKETKSTAKDASEIKTSTPDPNSIIIERIPSIPDTVKTTQSPKETEANLKIASETNLSTPDPNSIIVERLSSIPDAAINTQLPPKENETESTVEITSEAKIGTVDPNSIIVEKISSNPDTVKTTHLPQKEKETESSVGNASETKMVTPEPKSTIVERMSSIPAKNTQSPEDLTTGEFSSSNSQNLTPILKLNKEKLDDLASKQSVSNETEVLIEVNTEIISVNDTDDDDDVTEDDSGNTDEFIEVSTSGTKTAPETKMSSSFETKTPKSSFAPETESASSSITQTTIVDSKQNNKEEIAEITEHPTTAESVQATETPDECSPRDPTCVTEEGGRVIRCPAPEGLHPYPGDERRFLICEHNNIRVRYCAGDTIFNPRAKKCIGNLIF